eukprot:IDg3122t1
MASAAHSRAPVKTPKRYHTITNIAYDVQEAQDSFPEGSCPPIWLKVTERSSVTFQVVSVECMFCVYFGREEKNPDDIEGSTHQKMMSSFVDHLDDTEDAASDCSVRYAINIKNPLQWLLALDYLCASLSFRQAARILQSTKEHTVNLQHISDLIKKAWTFAVRHTAEVIFNTAAKAFDTLCSNWRDKIIGISTDGERKMTGRVSGVATRFQHVARIHSNLESMFKVSDWFKKHRINVEEYLEEKNPSCKPADRWWVQLMIVAAFSARAVGGRGPLSQDDADALDSEEWIVDTPEYLLQSGPVLCISSTIWVLLSK